MTENTKKLYLVVRVPWEISEDVLAIFDNRDYAQSFIDRFKSPPEYGATIIEKELNPLFYSDKTKDAYLVILEYKGGVFDCYRVDDLKESNAAFNSGFEYAYMERESFEEVDVFITVLATSETDAIRKAKAIRKNLITSGEWEKSWNEHRASILTDGINE